MRRIIRKLLGLTALIAAGSPALLQAQAYCALRGPLSTIHRFSPGSSGHRSIVETIDGSTRTAVSEKLPFTIHFNELGKHTLYVVLENDVPDGLIHARSEKGKWGLVEIVWFFDLDLKVRDFRFQRCRDRSEKVIESERFVSQLRGKGFGEIRAMLDAGAKSVVADNLNVPADALPLAITTLRSALKTIVVTENVWGQHLQKLRETASAAMPSTPSSASDQFPAAHHLEPIDVPYTEDAMKRLTLIEQADEWIIKRDTVEAFEALDLSGKSLGLFVKTQCTAAEYIISIGWTIDSGARIKKVTLLDDHPDDDLTEAFAGLEGFTLEKVDHCSTAAQLAAAEVLAISLAHLHL